MGRNNRRKIKTFILSSAIIIAGCAASNNLALIPTPVFPQGVEIPKQPDLAIYHLSTNDSPPIVMKAYVASVVALQNWGNSLTMLWEGIQ
jgi:hypothetical protein